ncbi:MAG TPA: hypothetical protein VFA86_01905 [Gammaproteobacteria bacterium]|nr:hypothetical protein [Gammaproteobacteria bacterium]
MSQRMVRGLIIAAASAALSVAAVPAVAQQPSMSKGAPQLKHESKSGSARKQELQHVQKRMQSLRQQLGQIRQAAFKHNPKLKKEQKHLSQLVRSTMKKHGDDPAPHQKKLKQLRAQFQKKNLKKGQRQKIVQQAQQEEHALRSGYRKALQDKGVQKAQKQFRHDMLAAMKKQNPKTDQLIAQYRKERKQMIAILTQGHGGAAHGKR